RQPGRAARYGAGMAGRARGGEAGRPGGSPARAGPLRPAPVPRRLGPDVQGGDLMWIAMVSEHASPLAVLGAADAGGQNVYVGALAAALAARGHVVDVYTRRDAPDLPATVELCPGVTVVH